MRDKKATEDDNVPGDVLKLLGDVLRLMIQLISNICETRLWPMDFLEVTVITLPITQSASLYIQQRL
jgi:hypothetical protein